ncbi:hypothetical protein [Pantoea sp. Mhis]|uniref:hypothetical protein n=1 Tax=Pantoea sp. Mhis TaxID=2576759 RepID=UPI001358A76D|nr:hypothetical protein [Pantoea sp. Mhis]MXP56463.1 hypothetical protein [Pantoea sp. Mhis]
MNFIQHISKILSFYIDNEIDFKQLKGYVKNVFFSINCCSTKNIACGVEIFHGRTLAFKDFGGRFIA